MRPKAKRPDTEAEVARGRSLQIYNTAPPQIGLEFRTSSTAPPQACTLIGAAAMPEIDGNRQHTMRAVPIGAGGSAPDVRQGALGGRRARLDVVT